MRPKGNTERFVVPAGLQDAICYGVVHIGTHVEEFKGEKKMRNIVYILYELPSIRNTWDEDKGEQPAVMSKKFTYTYSERGSLLDWIKTWSNGKINKKNIEKFDIDKLIGIGCKLQVIEDEGDNGTYSYIKGIIALNDEEKKTLNGNVLETPKMAYSVDEHDPEKFEVLHTWLQNKIKESQEYKKLGIQEDDDIPEDMQESDEEAAF